MILSVDFHVSYDLNILILNERQENGIIECSKMVKTTF